jgi:protein TonB
MVQPPYPDLARKARIEGTVEFTATISKAGTIENLALVHGHPLLVKAAEEAVLQWRYRPTLLNGEPVEVITDIMVNFRLSQ